MRAVATRISVLHECRRQFTHPERRRVRIPYEGHILKSALRRGEIDEKPKPSADQHRAPEVRSVRYRRRGNGLGLRARFATPRLDDRTSGCRGLCWCDFKYVYEDRTWRRALSRRGGEGLRPGAVSRGDPRITRTNPNAQERPPPLSNDGVPAPLLPLGRCGLLRCRTQNVRLGVRQHQPLSQSLSIERRNATEDAHAQAQSAGWFNRLRGRPIR